MTHKIQKQLVGYLSVFVTICLLLGAAISGCSHPGQATLVAGQCILDNGVLGEVLTALATKNYVQAISDLALKDAPTLVDCALLAIASQNGTGSGSGSGSGSSSVAQPKIVPGVSQSLLSQRAREVLATRRAVK
jgi:hypothetical protein